MKLKQCLFIIALPVLLGCQSSDPLAPLDALAIASRPKKVAVRVEEYCAGSSFRYSDFWALNLSVRIEAGGMSVDWDRDGLPNTKDVDPELGLGLYTADSNADGYGDLLMALGGFEVDQQRSLKFCAEKGQDTDRDLLTDCEEDNLIHTDPKKFDTDGDGIPDGIEVRSGLNPADPNDALAVGDGGTLTHIERVKESLPLHEFLDDAFLDLGLKYEIQVRADSCMDLRVSNIPVADASNGNLIQLFFFETGDRDEERRMKTIPVVVPRSVVDGTELKFNYAELSASGGAWN